MSCRAFQSFAISLISFERSMLDERESIRFRLGAGSIAVFTGIVGTCHVEGKRALSASRPKFQWLFLRYFLFFFFRSFLNVARVLKSKTERFYPIYKIDASSRYIHIRKSLDIRLLNRLQIALGIKFGD